MRVKMSMINRELRTSGRIFKILNPTFTESRMRLFAGLTRKFLRGGTDKSLECSEQWILRDDNSQMRVCIYKSTEPTGKVPGILWLHERANEFESFS